MFELPTRIKIGHVNFDVVKYYFDHQEDYWFGRFEHTTGQILINPDQPEEYGQDTLMHEALHAMLFMAGYHPSNEEKFISTISPLLCGFIKDNPEVIMYLMERKDERLPVINTTHHNAPSPELGT